jgi:hypothetical protein
MQRESEPLGHPSASDPKKCLQLRNVKQHTFSAMIRRKYGSRVKLSERETAAVMKRS